MKNEVLITVITTSQATGGTPDKVINHNDRDQPLVDRKEVSLKSEETARLNLEVPVPVMNQFKAKCYANGVTMKSVVLGYIDEYLKKTTS